MKPEMNSKSQTDERLSETLAQWKVQVSLPPRFQEQVWNRIARAEAPKPPSSWAEFTRWVEGEFARPALAASYLALLLFTAFAADFLHAHHTTATKGTGCA